MSPRPRTVSDIDILTATHQVISRVGPARFTLADVAKECSLSPATLVQRFGSKRGLLLALAELGKDSVGACFDAARSANRSPLDALMTAATEMTRHMKSPEELANGLAFLQIDLSDADFHALALENSRRIEAAYRELLNDAVKAGELRPCDTRHLARTVGAVSGGSLIAWAIHREGTAEAWVRADLNTLLAPYRTARSAPRAAARRPSRVARRSKS
jgi:AcrR family transcriptional regulator